MTDPTAAELEALADEAEQGYDPALLIVGVRRKSGLDKWVASCAKCGWSSVSTAPDARDQLRTQAQEHVCPV